jgi:hypothetical protein
MHHFRMTPPRVRYHVLVYAIAAAVVTACGSGEDSAERTRTTAFERNELTKPAESGRFGAYACDVLAPSFVARRLGVPAGRLRAKPNNSLDLTICEWSGGRVRHVKLLIDSAPKAQLRYYNLLAEQHEFHNADPERKARQIKGVGEDSAYGGAGAWWTRATRQLVAYDSDKMFKLRVNVRGFGDAEARAAAVELARRAVRKLRRRPSKGR